MGDGKSEICSTDQQAGNSGGADVALLSLKAGWRQNSFPLARPQFVPGGLRLTDEDRQVMEGNLLCSRSTDLNVNLNNTFVATGRLVFGQTTGPHSLVK